MGYWIKKKRIEITLDNIVPKHYISIRNEKKQKKFIYCEEYIKKNFRFAESIDYKRIRHLDLNNRGKVIELRVYYIERYTNLYIEKDGIFYDRLAL